VFIGLKVLFEHLGLLGFTEESDVIFSLLIPFVATIIGSAVVFIHKGGFAEKTERLSVDLQQEL